MMSGKLLVVLCAVSAVLCSEMYTDKYDGMDVDEIMENEKLFEGYFHCMMETGKCTPAGKELRSNLVDCLETGCAKCTEIQKQNSTKIIRHLIKNKIEYWEELCSKYDPDGVWRKNYEEEAKANGIDIPPPKK